MVKGKGKGKEVNGGDISPIRLGADCMLMLIEKERPPSRNRGVIKLYENLNHEYIAKIRGLLGNAYSGSVSS